LLDRSEVGEVFLASSAEEALDLYKLNINEIDVIISDHRMGEMSGADLLKQVLAIKSSKMPLFYLLTGDFDISEEQFCKDGGTGIISKPYDVDEAIEMLISGAQKNFAK